MQRGIVHTTDSVRALPWSILASPNRQVVATSVTLIHPRRLQQTRQSLECRFVADFFDRHRELLSDRLPSLHYFIIHARAQYMPRTDWTIVRAEITLQRAVPFRFLPHIPRLTR